MDRIDTKITAVIVTFNRLEKLKTTIEKSLSESFHNIVVIDNCSTDGTREYLDSLNDPRLIIKHLDENIGGAGGFHVGFRTATDETLSDWLVCYDDDAYPQEGLVKYFSVLDLPDNVASIAAAVYLPSNQINPMNIPRYNPFFKGRFYLDRGAYVQKSSVPIDMSSFVGYFIRTEIIRREHVLPRKELFIYADDLMYSLYWTKRGYSHLFVPKLKFVHDSETLNSEEKGLYYPLWKVYYTFRNGIELYRNMYRLSVYLFAFTKYVQLYFQIKYYPAELHTPYRKLVFLALKDGLARDFSKSFSDIVALSKSDG